MREVFKKIKTIRGRLSSDRKEIDDLLDDIGYAVPVGKHLSDEEGRCSKGGCFPSTEEGENECDYFEQNPPRDYPQPDCYHCCNGFCDLKYLRRKKS